MTEQRYKSQRDYIASLISEYNKAILKLQKKGRHVEAVEYIQKKKRLEEALKQTDNVEVAYQMLTSNSSLNAWFSKTMGLSIALADLACFYADQANNFLDGHNLFQSVETKEEMKRIREGIQDFRNFYNDLTEKQMRIQNFNLFDSLEQSITKSFFEDREMIYYKQYNK